MSALQVLALVLNIIQAFSQGLPSVLSIIEDISTAINGTPGQAAHTAALARLSTFVPAAKTS
jgi:hypothetical protein